MASGGHVRGLVQVPHPYLAVQVRYIQSDQLYYLVRSIAVYMSGILQLVSTSYILLQYRVCPRHLIVLSNLQAINVNNTVVLTIASLKYTVPYIVKYTYSTVLACMLVQQQQYLVIITGIILCQYNIIPVLDEVMVGYIQPLISSIFFTLITLITTFVLIHRSSLT